MVSPSHAHPRCMYVGDGGSNRRECAPGAPKGCINGCTAHVPRFSSQLPQWCSARNDPSGGSITLRESTCRGPWRPQDAESFFKAIRRFRLKEGYHACAACGSRVFNEVVLDGPTFLQHLPFSVAAFFHMAGAGGRGSSSVGEFGAKEEPRYTDAAYRSLLRHFNATEASLPLLQLDLRATRSPFSLSARQNKAEHGRAMLRTVSA